MKRLNWKGAGAHAAQGERLEVRARAFGGPAAEYQIRQVEDSLVSLEAIFRQCQG